MNSIRNGFVKRTTNCKVYNWNKRWRNWWQFKGKNASKNRLIHECLRIVRKINLKLKFLPNLLQAKNWNRLNRLPPEIFLRCENLFGHKMFIAINLVSLQIARVDDDDNGVFFIVVVILSIAAHLNIIGHSLNLLLSMLCHLMPGFATCSLAISWQKVLI